MQVKAEVSQVVDMMREYLSKTGAMKDNYSDILNSFSQRLQLHNNQDEIHSDLQNLLDTLGDLHIDKTWEETNKDYVQSSITPCQQRELRYAFSYFILYSIKNKKIYGSKIALELQNDTKITTIQLLP